MTDLSEHLPRLRRYARALTGDRYAADDLVQDTVERALNKLALWRPGSRLDSWLMTVMHNVFVNQTHRAATRRETSLDDAPAETAARATQADGLEVRDVQSALQQLSPEQREVLLLVALEEYSYDEAAQVLGIPRGTVMSRLSRARDRLHQLLDGTEARPRPLKVVK